MTKKILILAANPKDAPQLQLDQEIQAIKEGLQRSQKQDEFTLVKKLSVQTAEFRRAMLDSEPSIVHFCGHGTEGDGIAFEDDNGQSKFVNIDALSGLFELFSDKVECVVLNACFSDAQAEAIARHINYVVGIKQAISDKSAIEFAAAFYEALGAGKTYEFAYQIARNALELTDIPSSLTPILKRKPSLSLANEYKENGITIDNQKQSIISIAPTVFFDQRLCSAFPGIRGLHWFENPKDALDRLEIFFRKPIKFKKSIGHDATIDPIWWFRGFRHSDIEEFLRVNENKCILDIDELLVKKIAVFHSHLYWQSFIYIETYGEQPIGIYSRSQEYIDNMVESFGSAYEEYAMFSDTPISRQCYDDGAAVLNGKVIDTSSAKLRIRYLTDYNILIAAKSSPINSPEFSAKSQPLLNGILRGTFSFDNLLECIKRLPRHKQDA